LVISNLSSASFSSALANGKEKNDKRTERANSVVEKENNPFILCTRREYRTFSLSAFFPLHTFL